MRPALRIPEHTPIRTQPLLLHTERTLGALICHPTAHRDGGGVDGKVRLFGHGFHFPLR